MTAVGAQRPSVRTHFDSGANTKRWVRAPERRSSALMRLEETNTHIVLRVTNHFGYAIDKRYLPVLLPFWLGPQGTVSHSKDEGSQVATFGLFKIATPLSNITGDTSLAIVAVDGVWGLLVGC